MIINVYLPCCGTARDCDNLCAILDEVKNEIESVDYCYIVLGGDTNHNMQSKDPLGNRILQSYANLGLTLCNNYLSNPNCIDHTFRVESRNAYSVIDHFFVSSTQPNYVNSLVTLDTAFNFSDHLPLVLNLDPNLIAVCKTKTLLQNMTNCLPDKPKLTFNWKKLINQFTTK